MNPRTLKILLIEDNHGDARLIEEMLKEAVIPFKLEFAVTLSAGIKLIDTNIFDVILLDLGLPDSQGLGTLLKLNESKPQAPVIVLTGMTDDATGIEAVKKGAQDYLIKGQINKNQLARGINYAIERKWMEEELKKYSENLENIVKEKTSELRKTIAALESEIIERKRAEEELNKYRGHLEELVKERTLEFEIAKERAEESDRSKSIFLGTISHELRTPLNAIIGFSDMMSMGIGGNLNETQKGYINDIHNAGEHLLLIFDDLLDLSKVEAGKMELVIEKFSVLELLEETITILKNKAVKSHIDIIIDIDPQLEFMEGDKHKLIQVLNNLLSNAIKFSKEEGGTINVKVEKIDSMVKFSVSDTGIGIEKKNLDKLFKDFQQVDSGITRKYGGTGLGLSISRMLVEMMGGNIWVESEYGKGSIFTFKLPLKPLS